MSSLKSASAGVHQWHYAVAEFGKVQALKHLHADALRHYREAIRMAVSSQAPEVFFRHYTQCVLESLELTGSYAEVVTFCENADKHYRSLNLQTPLHRKDHGSVLERHAINLLKQGNTDATINSLQQALELAGKESLPLAAELLGWLRRGLTVDPNRLLVLQKKHNYFVVRRDQVNPTIARSLDTGSKSPVAPAAQLTTTAVGEIYGRL